jgi:serine/threonine protein kinase
MNDGTLKVFDFGMELLAQTDPEQPLSDKTDFIFVLPPEYAKDGKAPIDKDSANIWKAGCIIYELCTLKHVFESESGISIKEKLSKFEGNYEINIGDKFSNDIKTLLSKMLIAEPEKRATIEELINSDIVVKRKSNKLTEKEKLEKKLLTASIFTFK